ncbi:efflux RND transporter periplasmic adaptor subunit [Ferviditalea candida]|uniref:Efflux RND transporter periplasmic adaptor subunit n=1 Tax=Ferviditalea candida TaxID=3108399 RepID=A0ABU5ZE41_9BACL|nr:efflux RND transporter periplasmic adaptor subunit [Paenibacillaceae bacterium T2]
MKKLFILIVLGIAVLNGCSAGGQPESNQATTSDQQSKKVEVMKVTKHKIADIPEVSADIVPSVSLDVISKTGGDIVQILKKRGDFVKEGEVFINLHSTEAEFQRERTFLDLKAAQNALAQSTMRLNRDLKSMTENYNRIKNDYNDGLATKDQLDQAVAQLEEKQTAAAEQYRQKNPEVQSLQIALQQADQALAALKIKAPISGVLTDVPVGEGMMLQGGTKVGVIQKLDPIKIVTQLTPEELAFIQGKTELSYSVQGTEIKGKGKIVYISNIADERTNKYELNLELANKEMNLKPGMKAQVLLGDEQDLMAITVPSYCIVKDGEDAYVFVLNHDTVEKRKVRLGRLNEPNQEIVSGVKEGEMVVISGQNQLKDKDKLQLVNVQIQK